MHYPFIILSLFSQSCNFIKKEKGKMSIMNMNTKDDIIWKAIEEKKYKDIPEWLMANVSFDLFKKMVKNLFCSWYDINHLKFFNELINYCQFSQSTLVDNFDQILARYDIPYAILAAMLSSDYEWKRFIKKIESSHEFTVDHQSYVIMLRVQFYFYKKIPKPLILGMLKHIDSLYPDDAKDVFISGIILELYNHSFLTIDANGFITELLDSIRSMSHKFYWVDSVFSLSNIWGCGIPYYKKEFGDEYLLPFITCMNAKKELYTSCELELPDVIMGALERVVNDDSYNFDDKKVMYDCIISLSKVNINHIRFLKPFKPLIQPYNDVYDLVSDVYSRNDKPILREYGYLEGILKSYGNDEMQMRHIRSGGGIKSLIEDVRSVLYTEEGVVAALTYSQPQDILDMVENSGWIADIIKKDIIGHYDFDPVIHNLCAVISNVRGVQKLENIKMCIRADYNLVTMAMNNPDGVNYGSMIDISRPVAYNMVETHPQLVSVIPFDLLTYDQLIHIVNHKKSYVPINNDRGIECALLSTLELLVDASVGYLCDISDEKLGNTVLKYITYNRA